MSSTIAGAGYMRTVHAGRFAALAPPGRIGALEPLTFWPNKYAADKLDYTVDFSAFFAGEAPPADTLVTAKVAALPQDNQLTVSNVLPGGQLVTFTLAGGKPGQSYQVYVFATSNTGRYVSAVVALYVPTFTITSGFTSGTSG